MNAKVAIVCDWLVSRGGAERTIRVLADMFPQAPIYTSVYNPRTLPEFQDRTIITSFLQKMPYAQTRHPLYLNLMPYTFESFDLSAFDLVISSCHSCSKGIITKPHTLHISYCHSPMRYVWDNCHEYFKQYGIPRILQGRAQKILHNLRQWDRLAADRVDLFIANSEHVRRRIKKYYQHESEVIYPPVDVEKFSSPATKNHSGKYFLAVGRLTPYKRFDLIIEAFNELKLPLIIAGIGKEEQRLKKQAGRFITFVGAVSDTELHALYQDAHALIFPQSEDFGMIPVEAMSCGTPVIAFGDGGALETIVPGKTGIFFEKQTVESLKKAVIEFTGLKWHKAEIQDHANSFSRDVFEKKMYTYIEESLKKWQKEMGK